MMRRVRHLVDRLAHAVDRGALGLGGDELVLDLRVVEQRTRMAIQSAAFPDCAVGLATSAAG
jgi:hypothetical protein